MKKTIFFVFAFVVLASSLFLTFAQEGPPENIIEELKLFSKALGVIQYAYVKEVNVRDLFYEAVKGMVSALKDPYSQFIDPKQYELLKIIVTGEYAGLGLGLEIRDQYPAIVSIKPGSNAEKAGLQINDKILKVDGKDMKSKVISEVAALLRGEADVEVTLTIRRDKPKKTFDVKIKREKIELEAVHDVRVVGKAIGYMQIAHFQGNTMEQVDKAIATLRQNGMKALIIDLRGNDGGVLPSAVELAERFLPKGKRIVSVESKVPEQRKEINSTGEKVIGDEPLVVLVDHGSASASEIFAAAMQDHHRATIIGVKTFGKASVQSVIPLDERSAMKLTTARYISPNGRMIDGVGIVPDEVIEDGGVAGTAGSQQQIKKALDVLKQYF